MDVAADAHEHHCRMSPRIRSFGWLAAAILFVAAAAVSAVTIGWFAPVLLAVAAIVAASIWLVRFRQSFRSF